jgi:hypothetical protein
MTEGEWLACTEPQKKMTESPETLHLAEVGLDRGPLASPIVFQQPALVVVVVVEAPGRERLGGRRERAGFLVLGDLGGRHPGSPSLTDGGTQAKGGRKHEFHRRGRNQPLTPCHAPPARRCH